MPENENLSYLQPQLDRFLDDLAALSMMECGTYDKNGVDAVGRLLRLRLEELGLSVQEHKHDTLGNTLVARWRGRGAARLLLIGHLDTVYPPGWTQQHPFTIEGDRAIGPGTSDMKAGLLAGLYALKALQHHRVDDFAELIFLLNSDEEIGSPSSTALIERVVQGCHAALVLEAGRENGDVVTARKGMATFELQVQGRAAHAGVAPGNGRSAVLELAHQIVALHALNGTIPGATVNVGVVEGGTRPNVVPDRASARVDVRAVDRAGLDAIIAGLQHCAAHTMVPDTVVSVTGRVDHLPLEKTAASARLFDLCREAAQAAGLQIGDTASGGGSDGNTTGARGIPTLDGLGPVGGSAHSPSEFVSISSIVPRTAMLAGLIERICSQVARS